MDLILLAMHDFDVILGMDWLSSNHAVVDCFAKCVIFRILGQEEERKVKLLSVISALQAKCMLRKGCIGFLAYVIDSKAKEEKLEDIPIVKEFSDMFPEDLPSLPPSLVEFLSPVRFLKPREKPKNVSEIRSFLGLASYYRRFIVGFSKMYMPLTL